MFRWGFKANQAISRHFRELFFFSNFKEVSVGVLKRFKVFRWVQEVSKRFHGASMDSRSFQDSIGEHQKGSTHLNGRLEPM